MEGESEEEMQGLSLDSLPDSELVTVAQCADYHRVKHQTILGAINRGAIDARKIGAYWVMTKAACLAYKPAKGHDERGSRSKGVPKTVKALPKDAGAGEAEELETPKE